MILLKRVLRRIKQQSVGLEIKEYKHIRHFFMNKTGLEIGGPSQIFKTNDLLPIYADVNQIDGVNFSNLTVWENKIEEGRTYNFDGNQKGIQFIAEASNLSCIENDSYDFLLSSHSLEHCSNVIKTVLEWKRVVRSGGVIIIVVPNKRFTFDHKRDTTTFDHLLTDYQNGIDEQDLTHLQEIIDKHDISRDPGVKDKEQFIERSMRNFENRCLHHHVFDELLLIKLFTYLDVNILFTDLQAPFHIIAAVQKR